MGKKRFWKPFQHRGWVILVVLNCGLMASVPNLPNSRAVVMALVILPLPCMFSAGPTPLPGLHCAARREGYMVMASRAPSLPASVTARTLSGANHRPATGTPPLLRSTAPSIAARSDVGGKICSWFCRVSAAELPHILLTWQRRNRKPWIAVLSLDSGSHDHCYVFDQMSVFDKTSLWEVNHCIQINRIFTKNL